MPPADRKRKLTPKQWAIRMALGAVGAAAGTLAVVALREATLSTHDEPAEPGSHMDLVVDARYRHPEAGQGLDELVEAQVQACRLEVSSDVVGPIEDRGDGRFSTRLSPSMDQTDRRQFRGCLEDWMIDGVLLNVVSLDPA